MDTFEIFCNPTDVFYNRAMHILSGFIDKPIYKIDEFLEKGMNKFVEVHIAPAIFSDFEWNNVRLLQQAGVDAVSRQYGNGREYQLIDVKSSARYCKGNLNSFVLELGYATEKTQNFVVGWFLKEGIITTHYLLLWPKASPFGRVCQQRHSYKADIPIYAYDNIEYVDYALVEKDKLKKYLSKYQLTDDLLERNMLEWINNPLSVEEWNNYLTSEGSGIQISVSNRVETKPVNLKIDKSKYVELAISSGRVFNVCPAKVTPIP